jgi:hypothetical protein
MLFVEMAEGLHENGARSLQLTKGSSMRETGLKCIENKYQGVLYAWFELGCITYSHTSKAHHIMLPHSTFNIKQNARSQAKPEEFSLHPIWKEPVTLIKLA